MPEINTCGRGSALGASPLCIVEVALSVVFFLSWDSGRFALRRDGSGSCMSRSGVGCSAKIGRVLVAENGPSPLLRNDFGVDAA